ncbi:MAG TPA: hypothetical protein VJS38_20220 [Phenylobacterium sp.]|uniref:hypothetical protein n=1 Tax=Phenylobacterium sp. TaxID=1871053 RepID=UPI002B46228A|nr:hypothetical protein [Phenylobacterium sp.]HKR90503.1 hypothetical protein [Phenylobacterium sp.]
MTLRPIPPLGLRPLTAVERVIAREIFGVALDPAAVRILAIPFWRRAFVAGPRLIVWPAAALPVDFGAAPLALQAAFVHELAHVWQAQHGVGLLRAKLKAGDSAAAYAYDLAAGPDFRRLNIEQQAMVVEHAFLASRGAATPHPPELYAEASSAWRQG